MCRQGRHPPSEWPTFGSALLLGLLLQSPLGGQTAFGKLEKVASPELMEGCADATSAAVASPGLRIFRSGRVVAVPVPTDLNVRDSIHVPRAMDARILLPEADKGYVILAPAILCYKDIRNAGDSVIERTRGAQTDPGRYETFRAVESDRGKSYSGPAIRLKTGGLVIDWTGARSPLFVYITRSRPLWIEGTRLAISVDATGSGVLFVSQGTVRTAIGAEPLRNGVLYYIKRGVVTPAYNDPASAALKKALHYNGVRVWQGWLRWPPSPWMLAGVAGVGATGYLVVQSMRGNNGGGTGKNGTVIIQVPFH